MTCDGPASCRGRREGRVKIHIQIEIHTFQIGSDSEISLSVWSFHLVNFQNVTNFVHLAGPPFDLFIN